MGIGKLDEGNLLFHGLSPLDPLWSSLGVIVVACGVESVQAKDYNQNCSKDDDCILVDQLIGSGNDCTIPLPEGRHQPQGQGEVRQGIHGGRGQLHRYRSVQSAPPPVALCKGRQVHTRARSASRDAGAD